MTLGAICHIPVHVSSLIPVSHILFFCCCCCLFFLPLHVHVYLSSILLWFLFHALNFSSVFPICNFIHFKSPYPSLPNSIFGTCSWHPENNVNLDEKHPRFLTDLFFSLPASIVAFTFVSCAHGAISCKHRKRRVHFVLRAQGCGGRDGRVDQLLRSLTAVSVTEDCSIGKFGGGFLRQTRAYSLRGGHRARLNALPQKTETKRKHLKARSEGGHSHLARGEGRPGSFTCMELCRCLIDHGVLRHKIGRRIIRGAAQYL